MKELKDHVQNESYVSSKELQAILAKIGPQEIDSVQALDILQCCTLAQASKSKQQIVIDIWRNLKKQNNVKYQIQHYNCLLQLGRDEQDIKLVQTIFNEMIREGIEPNE